MKPVTITLMLFGLFAFGLPILAMQNNPHQQAGVHGCTGDCYDAWKAETGGVLQLAQAQAAARAEASPEELGKAAYVGCVACHGAGGEGGLGPQLAGQSAADIADKLLRYKNGETIGSQSNLMWSQAAQLSDTDIDNLAAFIETL
ncbi:c-type cytochrome [Pseudohalioglobus sediminis]|nr:c-type cytochrome [Pseudohalioglobus sediminis]